MTDIPVTDSATNAETTENIVYKESPRYRFSNLAALQKSTSGASNVVYYQPERGIWNNSGTAPYLNPGTTTISSPIPEVESYKTWSIFNVFCCFLILGLVACAFSDMTKQATLRGDIQGALSASKKARVINIIATLVGMISIIVIMLYQFRVFH